MYVCMYVCMSLCIMHACMHASIYVCTLELQRSWVRKLFCSSLNVFKCSPLNCSSCLVHIYKCDHGLSCICQVNVAAWAGVKKHPFLHLVELS